VILTRRRTSFDSACYDFIAPANDDIRLLLIIRPVSFSLAVVVVVVVVVVMRINRLLINRYICFLFGSIIHCSIDLALEARKAPVYR